VIFLLTANIFINFIFLIQLVSLIFVLLLINFEFHIHILIFAFLDLKKFKLNSKTIVALFYLK